MGVVIVVLILLLYFVFFRRKESGLHRLAKAYSIAYAASYESEDDGSERRSGAIDQQWISYSDRKKAQKFIDQAGKQPKDRVVSLNGFNLLVKDVRTLKPRQWLNDEVINFYLALLLDQNERHVAESVVSGTRHPRIQVFPTSGTHFMEVLGKTREKYDYKKVKKWFPRLKKKWSEIDKFLIPTNVHGTHWILIVINIQERRVEALDSLGGDHMEMIKNVRRYVEDDMTERIAQSGSGQSNKVSSSVRVVLDWQCVNYHQKFRDLPQQKNSYDCGVFTLMFGEMISRNLPINSFQQDDILALRCRIALGIMNSFVP